MSRFDLNNNHPIIPNSNQYFFEKKYVSIHSEDRDPLKFINPSYFEIEMPQDYLNVQSVKLSSWSFPANYSVFSTSTHNVLLTFKLLTLYNPGEHAFSDPLTEAIFAGLYYNTNFEYSFSIEHGFYNPTQMATELTNKLNESITIYLNEFFVNPVYPQYNYAAALFINYERFTVVYNEVGQKLWFGNNADQFVLTNSSEAILQKTFIDQHCAPRTRLELPTFTDFGLPSSLGFTRCDAIAYSASRFIYNSEANPDIINDVSSNELLPRFYYGDVTGTGDNGYWILPVLPGAIVYYLQAPLKINFMGPAYIYMEIEGLNCIDETSPYMISNFTTTTNQTNGVCNSAFAKIAVPTTPISQWFDTDMTPYKYFNPPAERIRKLKIKLRYHNNTLVDFGAFDFSFMLEICILRPQMERKSNIRDAFSLSQTQGI